MDNTELKAKFKQGKLPSEQDYSDLIDSIPDNSIDSPIVLDATLEKAILDYGHSMDNTNFNFSIITDTHTDNREFVTDNSDNYHTNFEGGTHPRVLAPLVENSLVDTVIANGDNTNGVNYDLSDNRNDQKIFINCIDRLKPVNSKSSTDVMITIGNHDDATPSQRYSGYKPKVTDILTHDFFYNEYMSLNKKNSGIIDIPDKLYFYKDYPNKRIRLVVMDSLDMGYTTKEEDVLIFPHWNSFGFGKEQITWLKDIVLETVPKDYTLVFVSHVPLQDPATLGEGYVANTANGNLILGMLEAYVKGSKYTGSTNYHKSNQNPEDSYFDTLKMDISVDYSSKGKRDIAGWFAGHTHREFASIANSINIVELAPNFGTTVDINLPENNSMTTISINTSTREISLLGFGKATNRKITY